MSESEYTVSLTFRPKEPLTIFALEMGGFLPLCFTGANILLFDRNTVSNALNIARQGGHRDNRANSWWLGFIDNPRYTVNPAFAALEGAHARLPTFDEFCEEFERCNAALKAALPNAAKVEFSDRAYRGSYALLEEVTANYMHEVQFLRSAAPLISTRTARQELQVIEERLFQLSRECGLSDITLSLVACLSVLYESPSSGRAAPGRRIIKPKRTYADSDAHNALMDLYALQVLIQGTAKLSTRVALCSSDKGLLEFWCALKAKPGGRETSQGFNVDFTLSNEMFPRLDDESIAELKGRLEAYKF